MHHQIVVVDTIKKPWPAAETLVARGVPLKVAAEYKKIRRHFTVGLRKWARESRN